MNWLAHAFLSGPDIEFRLGNLLADIVKGRDRAGMSANFLRGVQRHQVIDAFTDSHPLVYRSRARIGGDYRQVKGILVDVFYDHFLAIDWDQYASEPLEDFTTCLYTEIRAHAIALPEPAQAAVDQMICEDRLGSYRRIEGIEASLRRVSTRLSARVGKGFALEKAVSELLANFDGLKDDFAVFFPALQAHVGESPDA